MAIMKILVIGNGFDLQHNLPTKYSHFLEFCEKYIYIYKSDDSKITADDLERYQTFQREAPDQFQEFWHLMDCYWLRHFLDERNNIGVNWLNFESEIEALVKSLLITGKNEGANVTSAVPISYTVRKKFKLPELKTYSDAFDYLTKELKKLDRALEIYLSYCIPRQEDPEKRMSFIAGLKPDKLLSFNYTSTYFHFYCPKRNIDYSFIHGAADIYSTIDNCDLIIGYDDHYKGEDAVLELVPFEKYYQRIVNRTGAQYLDWLNELDSGREIKKEIYFYGHSMSPADGDIIKTLICWPNTQTTILYRKGHEEDRAGMIKNLAVILTPEELIKRTGKSGGTIKFEAIE